MIKDVIMSSYEQRNDIANIIEYVKQIETQDENTNNKKSHTLAALNAFIKEYDGYASICTTFTTRHLGNFVKAPDRGNISIYLDRLIYFQILLTTEYTGRTNTFPLWMISLYSYYRSELAYKNFDHDLSVFIDCNNYINTNELSIKFDNAVNTLGSVHN